MSHKCPVQSQAHPVQRLAVLLAAISAVLLPAAGFAFNSGSTGADGALAPTVNTAIQLPPSGVLNYTSVTIPAGVIVTFKKNALNTPVHLLVSGDVTVRGTILMRGGAATSTGTYGDGNQADDGIPGDGGPGGFGGGRGGRDDTALRAEIIRSGAGLGPGGGSGDIDGVDGCNGTRHYKSRGVGGAYSTSIDAYSPYCGGAPRYVGSSYGSSLLQPLIGGSGGGGGRGGLNYPGSGGGGGGGALLIAASGVINLVSTGWIDVQGGDAGGVAGTGVGQQGAGGSGGAVRLVATSVTGTGIIYANGGCINRSNAARQGCQLYDAGGSDGRIRIEAENLTYTATTQPAFSVDTPGPVFLSSLPSLRISSVAGSAVSPVPTGTADVTLPATIVNPVTVLFETANVPQGNTILLKVIPAYGFPIEAISPAITGTAAAGNASVQVNLPQGPSTLQAVTTYTVVVAMGEALSRFAQNERVDKVQLIASMGGENQAKLITITGKEYIVPVSVLQMVGFTG